MKKASPVARIGKVFRKNTATVTHFSLNAARGTPQGNGKSTDQIATRWLDVVSTRLSVGRRSTDENFRVRLNRRNIDKPRAFSAHCSNWPLSCGDRRLPSTVRKNHCWGGVARAHSPGGHKARRVQ